MKNLRLLFAPILALMLLAPGLAPAMVGAANAAPLTPLLGLTASTFAVLGAATVTNTGATVVNGNLGVSPGTAITGFGPGKIVDGTQHSSDLVALAAQADLLAASTALTLQACPSGNDLTGQNLAAKTLIPGVYCFSSSVQLTGILTLDAQNDPNAVFIFKMGSTLTTASGASVVMINGGSPANVYWQVGSSATLGTNTVFMGNIIALASITLTTGTVVTGRALARTGAVTMDTNTVGLVAIATGGVIPVLPAQVQLNSALKIHPLLQSLALTNPTGVIRVIVQQTGPLSGGASEHFTVIPALVTTVQLGSLAALALDPNVRYISPDGAVQIIPELDPTASVATSQPAVSGSFSGSPSSVDPTNLTTTYPFVTGATSAWAGNADLGVSPGTAVTGFPAGKIPGGTLHSADALAAQAQADTTTAYNSLTALACPIGNDLTGQDLGGKTLTAGVYCFSSSAQLTGTLTLDGQGNPNAVFVFKMGSTLTTASAASVLMANGASPSNVFWQVGSSATLGTYTRFKGTIIALASITLTTGTVVNGRAFARNGAVTMDSNDVGLSGNATTQIAPTNAPALGTASSYAVLAGSTVTSTGPTSLHGGPPDLGAGVTVAVLDSGVDLTHPDLQGRVIAVNVNKTASGPADGFGHGTHVTGAIVGRDSAGQYVGVAPGANVVSVKISDDAGVTYESDVLRGLQWIGQHQTNYNIRAVNMSLSAAVPQSYMTSPIDAATEGLWHAGLTMVASAGNLGTEGDAVWYAPGNDPLAITVGCLDDNQTIASGDDSLCVISSQGATEDGFAKPDLIAPGRKIVSTLSSGVNGQPAALALAFADRITADRSHIRLSGTSMSAPMVTGSIALLLAQRPGLTPDQIKQILVGTATAYPGQTDKAGTLNIAAALQASTPVASVQTPLPIGGSVAPAGSTTLLWDGTHWASTYWDGSNWSAAYLDNSHWNGSQLDNSHWNAAYWDNSHWNTSNWDNSHWNNSHWNGSQWDNSHWNGSQWDNSHWNGSTWDNSHWNSSQYDNSHWNGSTWDGSAYD
jgi:Ice-binding-like/Subtilase family